VEPTLAGFLGFVRNVMGITTTVLPDSSAVIAMAFNVALAVVNRALRVVGSPDWAGAPQVSIYALAVYNCAGDRLLHYAQDLPGAAIIPGSGDPKSGDPGLPFFAYTRKKWNLDGFVSGVIQSSSDEGTSQSMIVQQAAETFTLDDVAALKTPYGRTYLGFAQAYGTIWNLS
jgi:hypothetical protein